MLNLIKSPLKAVDLALAYSQVMIGALRDPEQFELAISERGEGETDFCQDLMPHVIGLTYAAHVLGDALEFGGIDVYREIYQAFGDHLINQRDGDFLDVVESHAGCLAMLQDALRTGLEADVLTRYIAADVFKRCFLAAMPCKFEDLENMEFSATCYAPFRMPESGNTITPLLFDADDLYGYSIPPDDLDRVREENDYLNDEDFDNARFFKHGDQYYNLDQFMRVDHAVFGTVGAYGESAFSYLLVIMNGDDSFHVVQETSE